MKTVCGRQRPCRKYPPHPTRRSGSPQPRCLWQPLNHRVWSLRRPWCAV